jgi:hypothetical protein
VKKKSLGVHNLNSPVPFPFFRIAYFEISFILLSFC